MLRLDPRLAPNTVAVLPLSKNEKLVPISEAVAGDLRRRYMVDVDVTGSIGKRYRRQDEVGTPYCVTIDFDTLEDQRGHRARPRLDDPGPRLTRPTGRPPPGAASAMTCMRENDD